MNVVNILTISRVLLTPIIIYFLFDNVLISNHVISVVVAMLIFTVASLTDYYDGLIARKYGLVSRLGEFIDPLADKFLTLGVFIAFAFISELFIFVSFLLLIVFREVIITGLRIVFLVNNKPMKTEKHGKFKTIIQITTQSLIFFILLHNAILTQTQTGEVFLREIGAEILSHEFIPQFYQAFSYPFWLADAIYWLPNCLIIISAYVTVRSGIAYLWSNWGLIWSRKNREN